MYCNSLYSLKRATRGVHTKDGIGLPHLGGAPRYDDVTDSVLQYNYYLCRTFPFSKKAVPQTVGAKLQRKGT